MSLTSLLSIARTALLAQQRAIDVTGHNIANASTEGYSRQRLLLDPQVPLQTTIGQLGRGVDATGIQRLRNYFLDATYRRENGDLGRFQTRQETLGQVEGVLGEPSAYGLAAGIDELFNAFGDLANDPAGQAPRELVRQVAADLARRFQDADARLSAIRADVTARMEGLVAEVNGLVEQIADLNVRARAGSSGQREAPDVKDQRDKLVDRLSSLAGVRALLREDGTVAVLAGDAMLVDGGQFTTLVVREAPAGGVAIGVAGGSGTLSAQTGRIAALAELASSVIPGVRSKLDRLARGLVTEINALHRGGTSLTGLTGIDFFRPSGLTASTMALSDEISNSSLNIAASRSGGGADNANALAIAALRTTGVAFFGGGTIGGAYQQIVSELGVMGREVGRQVEAQAVVVQYADTLRQSISGVSIDEEMTTLISQQTAFAAAARLVTVADEMMQDVLGMVR